MKRSYTEEEKLEALTMLNFYDGSVPLTARELDIPERTLFRWKSEEDAKFRQIKNRSALPIIPDDDEEEAQQNPYGVIRKRLVKHILYLTKNLEHDPYQLQAVAVAITRMIDRVIKLEALDNSHQPEKVIRVEYKDPDGSIHNTPMWDRPMTPEREAKIANSKGVRQAREGLPDDYFATRHTSDHYD